MLENSYQFVVHKGPRPGQIFLLTAPTITLGRDPVADIVLDNPEVSRVHARLVQTEEGYRLEDLGSTNGTFVDGRNIGVGPLLLEPGQEVQLGSGVILVYELLEEEDNAPATMLQEPDLPAEGTAEEEKETAVSPIPPPPATNPLPDTEPPAAAEPGEAATIDPMLPPSFDEPEAFAELPSLRQLQDTFPEDEPEPSDLPELPALADLPELPEMPELPELPAVSAGPPPKSAPRVVPAAEPLAATPPARGSSNRRIAGILAAVLLILLCCCCGFLFFMYQWGGDWLLRQMQLIP